MGAYCITERGTGSVVLVVRGSSLSRGLEQAARRGERLAGVDLAGRTLTSGFFYRVDFRASSFAGADLRGAYLRETDLRGADLRFARLNQAFLQGADLRSADLRGADLSRADLRGALLSGAQLAGAQLDQAQLEGAILEWRWIEIPLLLLGNKLPLEHKERLILDLVFHDEGKPFDWLRRLIGMGSLADRAIDALARHVREGDNAPAFLRASSARLARAQAPFHADPPPVRVQAARA